MSFLTCRCDLPQKLHRSCSLPSLARATCLLLLRKGGSAQGQDPLARILTARKTPEDGRFAALSLQPYDQVIDPRFAGSPMFDDAVDDPVLLGLVGRHVEVAIHVLRDLVDRLA